MKNAEFKAIEKRLAADLPGFSFKGRLMFLAPIQSVLRGFCFESSGFAKEAFYFWMFFQPLFVPAREIRFLFGHRLENGRRWRNDERDLESALLSGIKAEIPKLLGLHNAETVASALEPFVKPNAVGYVNPHCREALAYALIKSGQIEKADRVLSALEKSIDTNIAWEKEIALRTAQMRGMLPNRPDDAIEQLTAWEYETVHNLGLAAFLEEADTTNVTRGPGSRY
jgi:hypothetical protein